MMSVAQSGTLVVKERQSWAFTRSITQCNTAPAAVDLYGEHFAAAFPIP